MVYIKPKLKAREVTLVETCVEQFLFDSFNAN